MSNSRTKFALVVTFAIVAGGYLVLGYVRRARPSFNEAVAFVRSVHMFVESRTQQGSRPSASVQLRELIDGGYITPEMARRFDGSQVEFPPGPLQPQPFESALQEVLISLRLPDGREIVMSVDGSVHQSPR